MLTEVDAPLPPATRVGKSLLTVGVAAPLLYTSYIGYHCLGAWRYVHNLAQSFTEVEVVAYAALMLYGLVAAAGNAWMGLGFERDRSRWISIGAASGMAACFLYLAACLVQWWTAAASAADGSGRWLAHSRYLPYLLFTVFVAWVYLSAFKAANGGRAQSQLPGVLSILAGLLYSLESAVVALSHDTTGLLDRFLSLWPVAYGVLVGGLMLALACQLMDLKPNDTREAPPAMQSV